MQTITQTGVTRNIIHNHRMHRRYDRHQTSLSQQFKFDVHFLKKKETTNKNIALLGTVL